MMLKGKGIGIVFLLIEDKGADRSAGSRLGIIMQNVVQARYIGAFRSAVIDLPPFLCRYDYSRLAVLLQLLSDRRFIKHHGVFKARQVFFVNDLKHFGNRFSDGRLVKNIEYNEVKGYIAVGKALCFQGVV